MRECDGGRRGCWAYAAEWPGFSIVEVLFIHILCSRRKILAVRHISSSLLRGDVKALSNESNQARRRALDMCRATRIFRLEHNICMKSTFNAYCKFWKKFRKVRRWNSEEIEDLVTLIPDLL